MCSAYETGQFTGDVPTTLDGVDLESFNSVDPLRLIRRTDRAPVYLKDEGIDSLRRKHDAQVVVSSNWKVHYTVPELEGMIAE